ncbi:hypothetical protein DAI22_02g223700 [Oryza sativa Japonica Group]|nr:hypothetical protein DAI22_02g223700 [Oryza sativa Japonica Group]
MATTSSSPYHGVSGTAVAAYSSPRHHAVAVPLPLPGATVVTSSFPLCGGHRIRLPRARG